MLILMLNVTNNLRRANISDFCTELGLYTQFFLNSFFCKISEWNDLSKSRDQPIMLA